VKMGWLAALALGWAMAVAGCDDNATCQAKYPVQRVSASPDGVTLWYDQCNHVYFSSRGTQWTVGGKHPHPVEVPNADE